jgi:hypothetical protein
LLTDFASGGLRRSSAVQGLFGAQIHQKELVHSAKGHVIQGFFFTIEIIGLPFVLYDKLMITGSLPFHTEQKYAESGHFRGVKGKPQSLTM